MLSFLVYPYFLTAALIQLVILESIFSVLASLSIHSIKIDCTYNVFTISLDSIIDGLHYMDSIRGAGR